MHIARSTAAQSIRRILWLRYMQDPELHGLVFGQRKKPVSALI
jgi:hypothetical protein